MVAALFLGYRKLQEEAAPRLARPRQNCVLVGDLVVGHTQQEWQYPKEG